MNGDDEITFCVNLLIIMAHLLSFQFGKLKINYHRSEIGSTSE